MLSYRVVHAEVPLWVGQPPLALERGASATATVRIFSLRAMRRLHQDSTLAGGAPSGPDAWALLSTELFSREAASGKNFWEIGTSLHVSQ